MRFWGKSRRVVAVIAATALTMLVPAAPLVSAQPADEPDGTANATPPPPDLQHYPPGDPGEPNPVYTRDQQKGCVQGLGEAVQLQSEPWAQDVLRLIEAHKYATGRGVTVAVIDTGVNPHSYLTSLTKGSVDYVSAEAPNDCDGHGTQVAGIIAANHTDPTVGFIGVAPGATILSFRQSSAYFKDESKPNKPNAGNLDTLAEAIYTAANEGAQVINMSVDACRPAKGEITEQEQRVQSALYYAVVEKNVVPVVSAGNTPSGSADCGDKQNSSDPDHPTLIVAPPWFSDLVLSVAAVERDGDTAQFSLHGPWISVAAPGTEIISIDPSRTTGLVNQTSEGAGKQPVPIQGTSFAAPYVAGLAALLREKFPNLDARQIMNRIKVTAEHPAGAGGRNLEVGYGMIDPVAALTEVIPGEDGIAGDPPITIPSDVPPPYQHNWGPMQIALIGSGGGLVLLLLTLFIVHTVRRNRSEAAGR